MSLNVAERHALAKAKRWASCGACSIDAICCGAIVPLSICSHENGFVRCTKPEDHAGEHVACFAQRHRVYVWPKAE